MNIISSLPMILSDMRQYSAYKEALDNLDQQYQDKVKDFKDDSISNEDMELINQEYNVNKAIIKASLTRIENYLELMKPKDREYIMKRYVIDHNKETSKRTYTIFLDLQFGTEMVLKNA